MNYTSFEQHQITLRIFMKRFHKLIGIVLSITMITLISGCGGGGGDSTAIMPISSTPTSTDTSGTTTNTNSGDTSTATSTDDGTGSNIATLSGKGAVAMKVTDAPTDDEAVTGVFITFTGLRYQYKDTDEGTEGDEEEDEIVVIDEKNQKKVKPGEIDITDEIVEGDEDNESLDADEDNESLLSTSSESIIQSGNGWQEVNFDKPRKINLLTLQNGKTALLDQAVLSAGEIQHVRFILDVSQCYVELDGDGENTVPLTVPSGDQTGYKAIGGFAIPEGATAHVIADFDLRKSVTVTGNGKYILKPTIKIVNVQIVEEIIDEIIEVDAPIDDDMKTGEINGTMTLDANGSQVIVYAYENGSWEDNETTVENKFANSVLSTDATDGNYTLPWLAEGKYDLIVVANDVNGVYENILGYINDVPVLAGETTEQNITNDTLDDALLDIVP